MLLYRLQKYAEAGILYRRWLDHEPGNPIARHMSAAMNGEGGELRASDDYVKRIFDGFAAHFDASLEALGYRAPQLLVAALGDFTDMQSGRLDILDAGCGTGLCGALMRSSAHRLDGVDLSEGMIEKARERGLYDSLSVAELCAYMRQRSTCFDLVLSADTLCYFGDLEEPLEAAHGCLRQNGLIAFTVEAAADNDGPGYRLLQHGRYAHRAGYLDDVMRRAGLTVLARESVVLRKERGADVAGHLCIARRLAAIG
jgi:predicted TPR repeat methyltransferase